MFRLIAVIALCVIFPPLIPIILLLVLLGAV